MNLNFIQAKNETENFFSITKKCGTLTKQTHTKPQVILEIKLIKPRETILFNPLISTEGSWMIGLLTLKVCISFFKHNRTY